MDDTAGKDANDDVCTSGAYRAIHAHNVPRGKPVNF